MVNFLVQQRAASPSGHRGPGRSDVSSKLPTSFESFKPEKNRGIFKPRINAIKDVLHVDLKEGVLEDTLNDVLSLYSKPHAS